MLTVAAGQTLQIYLPREHKTAVEGWIENFRLARERLDCALEKPLAVPSGCVDQIAAQVGREAEGLPARRAALAEVLCDMLLQAARDRGAEQRSGAG
jgi:hypothetical protein